MTPKSERRSKILALLTENMTYSQIAAQVGVSRQCIQQLAKKLEGEKRKAPRKRQNDILRTELLNLADNKGGLSDRETVYKTISCKTSFSFSTTRLFQLASELNLKFGKPDQERTPIQKGALFGLWEVIERSMGNSEKDPIYYLCKCHGCGRKKHVKKYHLLTNRSTQCLSCAAKERWIKIKETA